MKSEERERESSTKKGLPSTTLSVARVRWPPNLLNMPPLRHAPLSDRQDGSIAGLNGLKRLGHSVALPL